MGSDAGVAPRKRRVPAVNGLAKEEPATAPPRLLTLPTVLTIGRVAAVPLLISSKLILFIFFYLFFFSVPLLLLVGS
jgi:hypothetical protein